MSVNIIDDKKYISKLNFDLAVVVAYGQIIPKAILEISKLGFINIHASILPKNIEVQRQSKDLLLILKKQQVLA